jgi:hypothetical protein
MNNEIVDILDAETAKYRATWGAASYRTKSPGEVIAQAAIEVCDIRPGSKVVDFGCGTGRAMRYFVLNNFMAQGVDIANNCFDAEINLPLTIAPLWDMPPAGVYGDWGYCTDVMEHIPPQYVRRSLQNISRCVPRAFFQIAHFNDGEWVEGTGALHLTVASPDWWRGVLKEFFPVVNDVTIHVEALAPGADMRMRSCWSCQA